MSQVYLITKAQIATFVSISNATSDDALNKFISDAQEFDLKDLLCRDFYFDIIKKYPVPTADFTKLVEGETYLTDDGVEINFLGLHYVLAHLTIARYIEAGHLIDTTFGFVEKTNEWTRSAEGSERRKLANSHRNNAIAYMREVKEYLERQVELDDSKFEVFQDCSHTTNDGTIKRIKSDLI